MLFRVGINRSGDVAMGSRGPFPHFQFFSWINEVCFSKSITFITNHGGNSLDTIFLWNWLCPLFLSLRPLKILFAKSQTYKSYFQKAWNVKLSPISFYINYKEALTNFWKKLFLLPLKAINYNDDGVIRAHNYQYNLNKQEISILEMTSPSQP